MGQYRTSRNIEASLIQYIESVLTGSWSNIPVEKNFKRIYEIALPSICVSVNVSTHDKVELGSEATKRTAQVLINIFADSDGLRLDLKDFLIDKLKVGCPCYIYEIENGEIKTKTSNGRIRVLKISDEPIDFGTNKDELDVRDRYRHLLTLQVSLGKVEE